METAIIVFALFLVLGMMCVLFVAFRRLFEMLFPSATGNVHEKPARSDAL